MDIEVQESFVHLFDRVKEESAQSSLAEPVGVLLGGEGVLPSFHCLFLSVIMERFETFLKICVILKLFDRNQLVVEVNVLLEQLIPSFEMIFDHKSSLRIRIHNSLQMLLLQLNTKLFNPDGQIFIHKSMLKKLL